MIGSPRSNVSIISPIRRAERLLCQSPREDLPPAAQWLRDNARALYGQAAQTQQEARYLGRRAFRRLRDFCDTLIAPPSGRIDEGALLRALRQAQKDALFTVQELRALHGMLRARLFAALLALLPTLVQECQDYRTGEALAAALGHSAPARWPQSPVALRRAQEALSQSGNIEAARKLDAHLRAGNQIPQSAAHQARAQLLSTAERAGGLITMLLSLPQINFARVIEKSSRACLILQADPTFRRMTGDSRALYLTHASRLARSLRVSEEAVCKAALALGEGKQGLEAEAGYYLLEQRGKICEYLHKKPPLGERLRSKKAAIYLGYLLVSAAAFAVLGAFCLPWYAVPFFTLTATSLTHRFAQRAAARLLPPRLLPRIKRACFSQELRVLVALPTVLMDEKHALQMCRKLSILYLANADMPLDFLLLSDFTDAQAAHAEGDERILSALTGGVRALNQSYGPRFYCLHRARSRNRAEGCYIGRERKRGALEMLGCLLCGEACPDTLAYASTPPEGLHGRYAYVITLDADTILPAGAAERLLGAMLHPLQKGRTGILQPRMQTLPMHVKTHAQALFGGMSGADGYCAAAQEFYQDVFGRGSFMGKGIYDPAALLAVSRTLPENAVLSHDLLEGELCHAQLCEDIACYDGHPARVNGFLRRAHRWTRGDWQLLPFLKDKRLDLLSRLKILDNLRRSLVPAARLITLILCAMQGAWLPFILALLPLRAPAELGALLLLPMMAVTRLDAILRALWRMRVSHKRLLQWTTAAQAEQSDLRALRLDFAAMLPGALMLFAAAGRVFWPGFALGAIWLAQPLLARWLDRPRAQQAALSSGQQAALRRIAADTLQFFLKNVNARTHHLPPDNVQLSPPRGAAMRTSPTNIGMYLLSLCAARELGLLDADTLFTRLSDTLNTLERLRTWHGVPYNWYDLTTLRPMPGEFVSAVDAGNLALALTVCAQCARMQLRQAREEYRSVPVRLDALRGRMQLRRLYDARRHLFFIGYDGANARMSEGHYDLLASESVMLSFAAIMAGEAPEKHWWYLGRAWTALPQKALLSWSGTMFEYLMGALLLPSYPGSTLSAAQHACVRAQQKHGREGVFGVSESGYAQYDQELNYRYQAFGLRELALDSRCEGNVIAPYAAALALRCAPQAACEALLRMPQRGWYGDQGFYEAADFTAGAQETLVYSHMAHHQGMILCAICNALCVDYLPRVLQSLPRAAAHLPLLCEMPPRHALRLPRPLRAHRDAAPDVPFRMRAEKGVPPDVLTLSGGGSTMLISAAGRSALFRGDTLLTRFDPDCRALDGAQFFLSNRDTGACLRLTDGEYTFLPGEAQCSLHEGGLKSRLSLCVDPLTGAAVYHLRLRSAAEQPMRLYAAGMIVPALATQREDRAHIAFSNLFISISKSGSHELIARRRERHGSSERSLRFGLIDAQGDCGMMNDRALFWGASGDLSHPRGMGLDAREFALTDSVDPCLALRTEVVLLPGHEANLFFALGMGELPADEAEARRAFALSADRAQVNRRLLQLDTRMLTLSCRMAARLLLTGWPREALESAGVRALWRQGISGDWPILLVTAEREEDCGGVSQAAHLFAYLLENGVQAEMVILLPPENDYEQPLRAFCDTLLLRPALRALHGRVRVLQEDDPLCAQALRALCALHIHAGEDLRTQLAPDSPGAPLHRAEAGGNLPAMPRLHQANGLGGFTQEGSYVILPGESRDGIAPWCHILANDVFGTLVCERGILFSCAGNSRLARVTAVSQDSVHPALSEEYLLREGDRAWSLTPAPYHNARTRVSYEMGAAVYQCALPGMQATLTCLTDCEHPAGLRILSLHNSGNEKRTLQYIAAVHFAMGEDGRGTRVWAEEGTAYAASPEMPGTAFFTLPGAQAHTVSTGIYSCALRVVDTQTPGTVGVLQRDFVLEPGQTAVYAIILGCCEKERIPDLLHDLSNARERERAARACWARQLDALQLYLPDDQLSRYANGFLPYQVRASRLMLRAGFYQSGGAWGFRDQLQDMLSLLYTQPERARAHLLLCASRQYVQGDVQHWWHPSGAGVRTRISDDLLFLPYVTARYVYVTADRDILRAHAPFLRSAELSDAEHDRYETPEQTAETAPLMEHCLRAIARVRYGKHGIPLMQGGDWNDGMDRVGGESAWLGFFLIVVLREFAPLCEEGVRRELDAQRIQLQNAMQAAWTGKWFLRAWYEDGRTLGAPDSEVPRIDLISQCFACFAGMPRDQVSQALEAAWQSLHKGDQGITLLLTPPFTPSEKAGYIGAYLPGVRENGGQYTHAVPWLIRALLQTGQVERAWEVLRECLPYHHAQALEQARHYRVEPYVLAADIYRTGRGGWTWYTGSASWLWVVLLCDFLGFDKQGDQVRLNPRVPGDWEECTILYRYGGSRYQLTAARDAPFVTLDGAQTGAPSITLIDDGRAHEARFPLN